MFKAAMFNFDGTLPCGKDGNNLVSNGLLKSLFLKKLFCITVFFR